MRTFTSIKVEGEPYLLAAYTCTPLVKFPVADLLKQSKVRGTTVAELGNHNRPLDMVVYRKDGKDYVLMANSARGVMKVSIDGIDTIDAITERVSDTQGLAFQTIEELKGVIHLDRLGQDHALLLVNNSEVLSLESIALP